MGKRSGTYYETGSFQDMLLHIAMTVVAVAFAVIAGLSFEENPPVIIGVFIVCAFLVWFSSYTSFIVTDESLRIASFTLFVFGRTRADIRFADIRLIRFECPVSGYEMNRRKRYSYPRYFNRIVAVDHSGTETAYIVALGRERMEKLAAKLPRGVRCEVTAIGTESRA